MNFYDILNSLNSQSGGMQRRDTSGLDRSTPLDPSQVDPTPEPDASTPDQTNPLFRGVNQGLYGLRAEYNTDKGVLQQKVLGDTAGAQESFQRAQTLQQAGAEAGPRVQSLSDVHGVADALNYGAGLIGSALPDLALMATGGGIAAALGKGLVRRSIARAAEDIGVRAAEKAGGTAAEKAALAAEKTADATSILEKTSGAQKAMETAEKVGHAVGTTAGGYPAALGSMNDALVNSKPGELDDTIKKAATGALGVAALNALPANRLLGRIGKPMEEAELTQKFLPRVAAEVAKQGGTMGALGVASTAATIATHQWINNNLGQVPLGTWDQYLDSFVGGAVMGGLLGGGVEAVRGAAQGAARGGASFLLKAERRVRNLYVDDPDAPDPGEHEPPGGEPPPPHPDVSGIDVSEDAPEAHEAFQAHLNKLDETGHRAASLEGLDQRVSNIVTNADQRWQHLTTGDTTPLENPILPRPEFPTKLQGMIAATVPADHPLHNDVEALKPLVASAEKLFHVDPKLTGEDRSNLKQLSQVIGQEPIERWAIGGPDYAKGLDYAHKFKNSKEPTPSNPAFEDEMRKAIQEHQERQAGAQAPEVSDVSETDEPPATAAGDVSEPPPDFGYEVGKLTDTDLRDKLTSVESGTPEHKALQAQLQQRLFKEGAPFIEQKTGDGPAAFRRFLGREAKSASSVEIDPVQQKGGLARRFIQLNTLLSNEIKRVNDAGGNIQPHDALMKVFGDLKLAGINVKPESVKAGKVWNSKDGTQVARLASNDKIAIQRGLTGQKMTPSLAKHTRNLMLRDAVRESMKRQGKPVDEAWLKTLKADAPNPEWIKEILRQVDISKKEAGLDREHGKDTANHAGADTISRGRIERNERPASDEEVGLKAQSEPHILKARKPSGAELKGKEKDRPNTEGRESNTPPAEEMRKQQEKLGVEKPTRPTEAAMAKADAEARPGETAQVKPRGGAPRPKAVKTSVGWKKVVSHWDVPLLGSSLKDGTVVIDKNWVGRIKDGLLKGLDRTPFLVEHEAVERDFEKQGWSYTKAHEKATAAEHAALLKHLDLKKNTKAGREAIKAYEESYKPDLLEAAQKKDPNVPPNLLEKPYEHPHNVEQRRLLAEVNKNEGVKEIAADKDAGGRAELLKTEKQLIDAIEKARTSNPKYVSALELSLNRVREKLASKGTISSKTDTVDRDFAANDPRIEADKNIGGEADHIADPNRSPQIHKETSMLNRMIARLGLSKTIAPIRVEHMPEELAKTHRGAYLHKADPDGTHVIQINKNVKGPQRIEVLAHELGHHIVFQLLGKALAPKKVLGVKGDALLAAQKHNELLAALKADHDKWREEHAGQPNAQVAEVEASRKPYFSAKNKLENNGLKTMGELTDEQYQYALSMHEWLADHISRALTSSEHGQGVIGEFFKGIVDKLKQVYKTLFGTEEGKKYAPAPAVEKWINGMFDTAAYKEKPSIAGFRKFEAFFNAYMNKPMRRILYRALERGSVEAKLNAKYGDVRTLKTVMENDETRLPALTYLAMHEMANGNLKLGPSSRPFELPRSIVDIMHKMTGVSGSNELATRLINDIKSGKLEGTPGYDIHKEDLATKPEKIQRLQKGFNAIDSGYRKAVARIITPIWWGAHDRIIRTQVPALLKAAALIRLHSSAPGKEGELDMLHARLQQTQQFLDPVIDAFKDLKPEESKALMDALQTRQTTHDNPKIAEAMGKIRKEADKWYRYASKAGDTGEPLVKMGHTENYFPVAMNPEEVAKRKDEFTALIAKHIDAARNKMQMDGASDADITKAFYEAATGTAADDGIQDWKAPAFTAKNNRLLDFIYKSGDADSIEKLASFQKKDPADVIVPYITQLTNRVEFARRFGAKGEKFEAMMDQARKQGADDYDIRMTRDFVNSAVGHYGAAGDRMWERFSKGFGGQFDEKGQPLNKPAKLAAGVYSDKATKTYDALMTFQNLNKLPLALLSSISDIMGPFVRSGGDFHGLYSGLKEGLLALKKNRPSQLKDLARAIGTSEDYLNLDSLRNNFGGGDSSTWLRKANDKMFKWNGLTNWSKALRYMALSVGQGFLLRHAQGYNKHSARYLFELGVKPEDIQGRGGKLKILTEDQRENASPEELARDDRVRKALFRFMEQSVLRTDVAQHPAWMNDPLMKVFAQYKQFGYAIESQIIDRVIHEAKYYGNYKVLLPFLAYMPITAMSEMMRSVIQYPGGNPTKQDWTFGDEMAWGAQRSGVAGPKLESVINNVFGSNPAVRERNTFDPSQFGPTAQTASQLFNTVRGRRGVGTEAESLLPAANLYSHW